MLAQLSTIEGQVRDLHTHNAIPVARVELSRAQLPIDWQYSNSDGRFRFMHLAPAHYTVSVDYSAYETAVVEFDVPATLSPITIELARKPKAPAVEVTKIVPLREYLVPKKARKEFDRARQDVRRHDCTTAIIHFENGLRAWGADASAHNDVGNCYRKLGQLERAEQAFKRAQALSDSVYVSLNLAEVYTAQGRFNDAKTVLEEALRRTPSAGDAYYGLALVDIQEGLSEDAEAAALQADSRPHKIADLHLVLAEMYWRKQDPEAAFDQLESYLKEAPHGSQSEQVRQVLQSRQSSR
jgi:tetratricopeptide (TPR) repeat protein